MSPGLGLEHNAVLLASQWMLWLTACCVMGLALIWVSDSGADQLSDSPNTTSSEAHPGASQPPGAATPGEMLSLVAPPSIERTLTAMRWLADQTREDQPGAMIGQTGAFPMTWARSSGLTDGIWRFHVDQPGEALALLELTLNGFDAVVIEWSAPQPPSNQQIWPLAARIRASTTKVMFVVDAEWSAGAMAVTRIADRQLSQG